MPQLLLELFSEEIPARMQATAQRDLERLARDALKAAELAFEDVRTFAGPRRLTLVVDGLPAAQSDRTEERKGPRVGAPEAALAGFVRSAGVERSGLTERDGAYFAMIAKAGRPTAEIVAEIVQQIVHGFPWPKSMTSGLGRLKWVRPLQRILCVFDRQVVPLNIEGTQASDLSEGHRFMGPGQPFRARDFDEYREALAGHFVVLDAEDRKARILGRAREVCAARGLELVEDAGLLEEVAGLAEWPVAILGDMDDAFLELPAEVIRTSMRVHQRYFAVRQPVTGALAPHFVVIANIEADDDGRLIAAGNARVLSARLSDARFFWEEDLKVPLEARLEKLKGVTFHAKLGTMYERVQRIEALAREIAPLVGADPELAARAARLAKADLASGMVSEFPELQGVMGGYYARYWQVEDDVVAAIGEHYKPLGPSDSVPTAPVSIAVALADKLDTLVGFFAIDEKPTGSRDPFALRRAALGVVRILLEAGVAFPLNPILKLCVTAHIGLSRHRRFIDSAREIDIQSEDIGPAESWNEPPIKTWVNYDGLIDNWSSEIGRAQLGYPNLTPEVDDEEIEESAAHYNELKSRLERLDSLHTIFSFADVIVDQTRTEENTAVVQAASSLGERLPGAFSMTNEVMAFLADRLKVLLRDQGARHDLVDAVFALGDDDLVLIVRRVEALDRFLQTEDGANLLAAYKRASNILTAEAKNGELPSGPPASLAGAPVEETALIRALGSAVPKVDVAIAQEDFAAAMRALASLRAPVDAFFDKVLVNSEVAQERDNRLKLLSQVRAAMSRVADFSLVSG
ncbi:MAG: glycine--tRNA ligase subunit beta [Caulobacterales bacterium]